MRRFQIDPSNIHDGRVCLDPKESHHAYSVLRLKAGEKVELFDGLGGKYSGIISGSAPGRIEIRIQATVTGAVNGAGPQWAVAVSVVKPDRMEWMIEKSCELGVSAIYPLRSARSVIKMSADRWLDKTARWRKIAAASCKQCGLARIPEIHEISDFSRIGEVAAAYDRLLIPTLAVKTGSLYDTLKSNAWRKVLVLIGPEGDFTPEEVTSAAAAGAVPVSLGPLVLRTETAAVYALSVLNFYFHEIRQKE